MSKVLNLDFFTPPLALLIQMHLMDLKSAVVQLLQQMFFLR